MAQQITPKQTRTWFTEHMQRQPDYGFRNAILNVMLHPKRPFNTKRRRELKPGFLIAIAWLGTAVALFALFNCVLERS
jgi:hypothetical protein